MPRRWVVWSVTPVVVALVTPVIAGGLQLIANRPAEAQPACGPPPPNTSAPPPPLAGFNPIQPTRVLDTRTGLGGPLSPVAAGCTISVDLSGLIPPQASGVALNLTAVDPILSGWVRVWPCDAPAPTTSSMNPAGADVTANLALVQVLGSRSVCIMTTVQSDLVADVTGWFGDGGSPFHELGATRILDTRVTGAPLAAGTERQVPIAGTVAGVPSDGAAVAVQLTVTDTATPGFLTAYPCGMGLPLTSNVNYRANDTRANEAMVGLGSNGALCIMSQQPVNVVIDLMAWFGGNAGLSFSTIVGSRVVDSRVGTGGWNSPLAPGETRSFDPNAAGTLPANASAIVLSVVSTNQSSSGYLTFFPCGSVQPGTSSLNYVLPIVDTANLVTVSLGSDAHVCVFSSSGTDVVIDLLGSYGAVGPLRALNVTTQTLSPDFSPDVHDYTLRCAAGSNSVQFSATAVPGGSASYNLASGQSITGAATLTENQAFQVTATTPGGSSTDYWIRCLPYDFPAITARRPGTPTPGWYLVTSTVIGAVGGSPNGSFVMILDGHGTPVWYQRTTGSTLNLQLLPNGDVAWTPNLGPTYGAAPNTGYEIHSLDGTLIQHVTTVNTTVDGQSEVMPTDHHELLPLPDGNFMLISYPIVTGVDLTALGLGTNQSVAECDVQEVTPGGALVWNWSSQDHLDITESVLPGAPIPGQTTAWDLFHCNSLDADPVTGDVILSSRNDSAVYRINKATGAVEWKLGGTAHTHDPGAKILQIVGDPGPSAQHDARLLPNGDISLFDDHAAKPAPARGIEYALDLTAGTAQPVWQFVNPANVNLGFIGSTRIQADGGRVIEWGGQPVPAVSEVDATNRLVFTIGFDNGDASYRAIKVPLTSLDVNLLRLTAGRL